jgi:alpha-tubulin suppressor-like RCC1 family protein
LKFPREIIPLGLCQSHHSWFEPIIALLVMSLENQPMNLPHLYQVKLLFLIFVALLIVVRAQNAYALGSNSNGQLGQGNNKPSVSLLKVNVPNIVTGVASGSSVYLFTNTSDLYGMGYGSSGNFGVGDYLDQLSPINIRFSGIKTVVASAYSAFMLTTNGTVWGMGQNTVIMNILIIVEWRFGARIVTWRQHSRANQTTLQCYQCMCYLAGWTGIGW